MLELPKNSDQRQISFYKTGTNEQALLMFESQRADIAILPSFIRDEGIIENIKNFNIIKLKIIHFIILSKVGILSLCLV